MKRSKAVLQSRRGSLNEALINVAIGYWVMLGAQLVILPYHGINVELSTNMSMGLWFTVVAVARTYLVRRLFNHFRWGMH